jgi:hypothetical protein
VLDESPQRYDPPSEPEPDAPGQPLAKASLAANLLVSATAALLLIALAVVVAVAVG